MDRIVVGVDASDASIRALEFAARLARDTRAALHVVHVRHAPAGWADQEQALTRDELDVFLDLAAKRAAERTAEALEPLGLAWHFETRSGDPADQLDLVADRVGADLIVVGSRGHTVVHRLLLGSVSNRLLHQAERPVLVVR